MNFQRNKINNKPKKEKKRKNLKKLMERMEDIQEGISSKKRRNLKKLKVSAPIIISIALILLLTVGIVKAISKINFTVFLTAAGDELLTDAYGHTNFLILGTGGKNHDGGDLTDTILVASLDQETKLVSMLSIPRDLWVEDDLVGNSRINEVYFNAKNYYGNNAEGLEHMKGKVEEMIGAPIHYWVMVDFTGFKEIVDAVGGIDIYVEEAIYDPYYPKDGTYLYEPFSIAAGEQHMDGEIALKYARSRKTTSDFDRARRQQQVIFAVKEKALSTGIIFSQEKITKILSALKENVHTNIKIEEILTLGGIADEYSKDQISQRLIHDNPVDCGGFLYTPERQYYSGMFVLVPAGGFEFLHRYSDLNFNMPLVAKENSKLHILNGTKTGGIAGEVKQILQRYCFDVNRYGNARSQDITQTTYYYKEKYDENGDPIDSRPHALDFLQTMMPGVENTEIPTEYQEYFLETDIVIEIGEDYVNSENYIEDPFVPLYYLYSTPAGNEETETTETATE